MLDLRLQGEEVRRVSDTAVGVLVVGVVAVGILAVILRSAGGYMAATRGVKALRYLSGTLKDCSPIHQEPGLASIEFVRKGIPFRLEISYKGRGSYPEVRVAARLPHRGPGTLHILPQNLRVAFLQLFGSQDLIVGNRDFDLKYVVRANPRSLVQILFAPDRRDRLIRSIDRLTDLGAPTIDLNFHTLVIRARQNLADVYAVMSVVETAEEILEYLAVLPQESSLAEDGVQIEEVRSSKTGECPVCGTFMEKDQVRCELCRTPHHSECWAYMGRCSTYACAGKRSVA